MLAAAPLESDIQIEIVAWLRLVAPQLLVVSNKNEGSKSFRGNAHAVKMGRVVGISDLTIFDDRPAGLVAHFMEVKRPKGKLRPAQEEFRMKCLTRNWPWCVVHSVDEARVALVHWKIETREVST